MMPGISKESFARTTLHPGGAVLRRALRQNVVSFPSQVPVFLKDPPADMQWRVVLLFFVCRWNSPKIAARFNVPKHRIWEIVNHWSVRALALGYIQIIDADAFEACCCAEAEEGIKRDTGFIRLAWGGRVESPRQTFEELRNEERAAYATSAVV